MWTCVAITVLIAAAPEGATLDAPALAAAIDRELAARFAAESITPAPPADDAEFLRRASLDLIGRIPTTEELIAFLGDNDPLKRRSLIDHYVDDPQHAGHFSRVWRALLLPEAATDRQLRYFQPGLEAWLRDARERDVGCDELVRGLIAMPLGAPGGPPQMVLTDLRAPNPLAYIASKEADPAKLASSTARLFLGIRLECAQCHDHPFDHWTHENFWSQAAFFAGLKRRGKGPFAPLSETPDVRMITPMESESSVAVAFLTGDAPVAEIDSPRAQLAAWITSPDNKRFAQAMSNRVWGQLMGIGLVTPVDDFHEQNPPSHPEVLDLLADSFVRSGFDIDLLCAGICQSATYQRTSRMTDPSQTERTFARGSVKALSGDQLFDSLAQSVSYQARTSDLDRDEDPVRRQFLELFADQDPDSEPETSVAAALTLINGKLTDEAASIVNSPRLTLLVNDTTLDTAGRIDALVRATVSRPAEAEELATFVEYVGQPDSTDYNRRLGDVYWTLLNSAEFRWNH